MRHLYTTRIVRPFPPVKTPRSFLNYSPVAWCPYHDLIALVSGCGAVSVFHPDSPTNATLLTTVTSSNAKHVAWRKSLKYPPLLAVADESSSVTFWLSSNCRVNEWHIADVVHTSSQVLSIGWNSIGSAFAALLSDGQLLTWHVPDYYSPASPPHISLHSTPNSASSSTPQFPKSVRPLPFSSSFDTSHLFGRHLRCASIAPGHVDPTSIALVTVSSAQPTSIHVWQVFFTQGFTSFDVSPLATTEMRPTDTGACIACAIVPPSGMLFAISSHGIVSRWRFQKARSGVQHGWYLQQHAHIRQQIEHAQSRSVLLNPRASASPHSETIPPQNPLIYAFQVSHDCESMILATSAGVLLWDVESFTISDGHCSDTDPNTRNTSNHHNPIWSLCFSPTASAVFAANFDGYVNLFTIVYPISQAVTNTRTSGTIVTASKLVDITHADGLHGGWDLLAPIAFEGPIAASGVYDALIYGMIRPLRPIPPSAGRIQMAKAVLRHLLNADDAVAIAAENILHVAVTALESSRIQSVEASLSLSAKDTKSFSTSALVAKVVNSAVDSTSSASAQQFASAPLADWIMTFCSVWLQRCAQVLSSYDPRGGILKAPWVAVVSMIPHYEKNTNLKHGIVYNIDLLRALRPASVAAVSLLAIQSKFAKQREPVRHHRFSKDDACCIVAAFWEVSHVWESACLSDQSKTKDPSEFSPSVQTERMLNATVVLGKHLVAANVLAETKELRVHVAEEALGLRGYSKGAGYIMSRMRSLDLDAKGKGSIALNLLAESCKYDLLTGRRLPPGVPLRQCIVSGLLAADRDENEDRNERLFPWIDKWRTRTPFGGPWAVVTPQSNGTLENVFFPHQFISDPKSTPNNPRKARRSSSQKQELRDSQIRKDPRRKANDISSRSTGAGTTLTNRNSQQTNNTLHVQPSSAQLSVSPHHEKTVRGRPRSSNLCNLEVSEGYQSFANSSSPSNDLSVSLRGRKRRLSNSEPRPDLKKHEFRNIPKFEGTDPAAITSDALQSDPPIQTNVAERMPVMVTDETTRFRSEITFSPSTGPNQAFLPSSDLNINQAPCVYTNSVGSTYVLNRPAGELKWANESSNQGIVPNAAVKSSYPRDFSRSNSIAPPNPTSNPLDRAKTYWNGLPERVRTTRNTSAADGSINENIVGNIAVDVRPNDGVVIPPNNWNRVSSANFSNQVEACRSNRESVVEEMHLKEEVRREGYISTTNPEESCQVFGGTTAQPLIACNVFPKSRQVVANVQPGPDIVKRWSNCRRLQNNNIADSWHMEATARDLNGSVSRTQVQDFPPHAEQVYVHRASNISNACQNMNSTIDQKLFTQRNFSAGSVENVTSASGGNLTHGHAGNTGLAENLEDLRNNAVNGNRFHSVPSEGLVSNWGEEDFKDNI